MNDKHVHFHTYDVKDKSGSVKPVLSDEQRTNNKRKQSAINAKVALMIHSTALVKNSVKVFNALFLTLFYSLRLLGFWLLVFGKKQKKKIDGEKKEGGFKW